MTIQECIDKVDAMQTNSFTVTQKVEWLSSLDGDIINDVLKTHEGYNGMYDSFSGYSDDNLTVSLVALYPYDKLYVSYLRMMIDYSNGDIKRYNNSAMIYNSDYTDFVKSYNKTHMPIVGKSKAPAKVPKKDVTDAEIEQIVNRLTYNMTEYFSNKLSDDKIADVVNRFVQNNLAILKGKDGYTPKKGVDYLTEDEIRQYKEAVGNKVDKVEGKGLSTNDFTDQYKNQLKNLNGAYVFMGSKIYIGDFYPFVEKIPSSITPVFNYIGKEQMFEQPYNGIPYLITLTDAGGTTVCEDGEVRAYFGVSQDDAIIFKPGMEVTIALLSGEVYTETVYDVVPALMPNPIEDILIARIILNRSEAFLSGVSAVHCSPTAVFRTGDNIAVIKVAGNVFYEVLSHDYGKELEELADKIGTGGGGGGGADLSNYATIDYVNNKVGYIEEAVAEIKALQNQYIGGDSE